MTSSHSDVMSLARVKRTANGLDEKRQPPPVPRPHSRWRTRVLLPLAILVSTAAVLSYAASDAFMPRVSVFVAAAIPKALQPPASSMDQTNGERDAEPSPQPPPDVDSVGLGSVVAQAPGWIEPSPYAVIVPALAEGVVQEVLVLEGQAVQVNDVVVRLIDEDARFLLLSAQATRGEREADVERANAGVATAESLVLVEQAAVAELADEVNRKKELVGVGGIGSGEYHRMEIRLSGMQAKVITAQRQADESRAALKQAQAALVAAEVVCKQAQLQLSRMEVKSPIQGVVLSRLVEPGSRISMGSGLGEEGQGSSSSMAGGVLRLYDPAHLQVRVDVPLADAAKVGVGTKAVVTTEALPDQTFTGRIVRVMQEANIQRNTVQFKVLLDAPSAVLKPEMLTRVKLYGQVGVDQETSAHSPGIEPSETFALLIPTSAVTLSSNSRGTVWLVDRSSGSPVALRRDVDTSPSINEGFTTVIQGLKLGDRVIVDAPITLTPGTRLRVVGERVNSDTPDPSVPTS